MKDNGLRGDTARYTKFADRMIRAVYGKTRYNPNSSTKLFEDLIPPSQEAFALLLYKNGYENWVWMHDHACMTLDGSDVTAEDEDEGGDDDEGCPHYKYIKMSGGFTSRNGGWTREGMTLYNELYLKVRGGDRQKDNGAFGRLYMEHRVTLSGKKRKRRNASGAEQSTSVQRFSQ